MTDSTQITQMLMDTLSGAAGGLMSDAVRTGHHRLRRSIAIAFKKDPAALDTLAAFQQNPTAHAEELIHKIQEHHVNEDSDVLKAYKDLHMTYLKIQNNTTNSMNLREASINGSVVNNGSGSNQGMISHGGHSGTVTFGDPQ